MMDKMNTNPEDTRFSLKTFIDNEAQTKLEYKSSQREIRDNGRFIVNKVNIYTPELAVILISDELPARNMDTGEETTINSFPYFKTYIKAFNEGVKYFDTEFNISPNTLYGANAEQYVKDIQFNYFYKRHPGGFTGWQCVKTSFPVILTHKQIKLYGYYSGIVSKIEEMVTKHLKLFQTFDKCEHDLLPQQAETKTKKFKIELGKFGFFDLPTVEKLSDEGKEKLIELISTNELPYCIAMFNYLGFINHLDKEYSLSNYKRNIEIAKWFNSDKDGRAVRGNISSLLEYSKENKQRYTAHLHKETVQNDYYKLK